MHCATMRGMATQTIPEITVGDRLRRALDHGDVKVKEMQDELGISHGTMSNYLSNKTKPNLATMRYWADRCEVDLDWLLGTSERGMPFTRWYEPTAA